MNENEKRAIAIILQLNTDFLSLQKFFIDHTNKFEIIEEKTNKFFNSIIKIFENEYNMYLSDYLVNFIVEICNISLYHLSDYELIHKKSFSRRKEIVSLKDKMTDILKILQENMEHADRIYL